MVGQAARRQSLSDVKRSLPIIEIGELYQYCTAATKYTDWAARQIADNTSESQNLSSKNEAGCLKPYMLRSPAIICVEITPVMSTSEKIATPPARVSNDEEFLEEIDIIGDTSPGVRRAKILADNLSPLDRIIIFVCLFLVAYVFGLDGTLRYVYQVRTLWDLGFTMGLTKKTNSLMQRLDLRATPLSRLSTFFVA